VFFFPYDISFEYDSHMFRELVSGYFLAADSETGFYNLQRYFSCFFVFVSFVLCIALNLTPDRLSDLVPFSKKLG
jgi:hypothetical protein